MRKQLVTMALPYANGSIHLGHLVEAVQTDIYVRALKAIGEDVIYVCADDTHGTPIEVNAAKAGIPPEQFVARFHEEHLRDYTAFEIDFDVFSTTNSDENRLHAEAFFAALTKNGDIEQRQVEQLYCEVDKRFLPDRFVRGTCPKCGAVDQYGDGCEKCGSTYDTTELKGPYCSICKEQGRGEVAPVRRSSNHYFVRLANYQSFLKTWIDRPGTLQPEIARSLEKWLSEPLKDWDISRDAPYFGFKIPGEDAKYFYVWLDAPIGYLSSTEHWATNVDETDPRAWVNVTRSDGTTVKRRRTVEDYWGENADADITHFIGKDIVYFHTLFWPAMLEAVGRKVPTRVHVHGMLTVEGTKMSKSRGTFINAREYLDAGFDVEWLRYFYAGNLGPHPSDIDLSLNELKNRVNGELLNNVGNLANRALSVLWKSFGGKLATIGATWSGADAHKTVDTPLGVPPSALPPSEIWEKAQSTEMNVIEAYRHCDTRLAIQLVLTLSSLANERLQRIQPWKLLKEHPLVAQQELTFAINIARTCARLLAPIVPAFAKGIEEQTNAPLLKWNDDARWTFHDSGTINEPKPLVRRVEDAELVKFASRFAPAEAAPAESAKQPKSAVAKKEPNNAATLPAAPGAAQPTAAQAEAPAAQSASSGEIGIEQFAIVDLRAGKVVACERVPKADKLLKLTIDLGEGAPRTIVSGIAQHYAPEELVGKTVAVVANLAKKALRGIESHGMVLAASGGAKGLTVVELPGNVAPGARVK